MYNFDKCVDRRNTDSIKWDSLMQFYGDSELSPYWIADMDFEVFPELKEAMVCRAMHPNYGYTFASTGYFESIINWFSNHYGLEISQQEIIPVPCVITAISFAVDILTQPNDRILINSPVYTPFFNVVKDFNRRIQDVPLLFCNGKYQLDFKSIENELSKGVKMYILCSPHNPVGRVWSKQDLTKIVELCYHYKTFLVSDEIHGDIVYSGHKQIPILKTCDKAHDISLMLSAPSKTFNIAGLKSSMIFIKNPELYDKMSKRIDKYHLDLNLFGYLATEAAYKYGERWLKELLVYLEENARFVCSYVSEHMPRVKVYMPESTYLMWMDFSDYNLTQEQLMCKIQQEAHLALNSGTSYGEQYIGFARLNIATSREYLRQGLEKLTAVF